METLESYVRRTIDCLIRFSLDALRALICAERGEEREQCIEAAARAMADAAVDQDVIREQLQKQFDLRRSEALSVIHRIHGELAVCGQGGEQPAGQ